jgi:ankyrin repeat protein
MKKILLLISLTFFISGCLEPTPTEQLTENNYLVNNLELTRAVSTDNPKIVELLFQTEVNTTSDAGSIIMPFVVSHKNHDILEIFLKNGANSNVYGRESLKIAIENQDITSIQLLMKYGADPDRKNSSGKNAIAMVLKKNDEILKELIKLGADYEPFMTSAVAGGDLNLIKKLQLFGADINVKNGRPLTKAIEINDFYVADFLIRNGAKVTERNTLKTNHLMQAIEGRNAKLAELLIIHGADINFQHSQPLKRAIAHGQTAIVKTLLHHGAKTDITIDGNSLVKFALKNNLFDIAKLLIDFNVDTNIEVNGSPLILYALWDKQQCIAKSAILAGTDINVKDRLTNESVIKFALRDQDVDLAKLLIHNGVDYRQALGDALYNKNEVSIKLLLKAGADINKIYDDGLTILTEAIEKGNKESIELLIKYGIDTNIGVNNDTPLSFLLSSKLTSFRKAAIAKILIENGANTNQVNKKGQSLLAIAAYKNDLTTLSILLTYGSNINQVDTNGWTPMMYALDQNNINIVKTLLFKGANVDTPDLINDWTPLMYAIKDGKKELVEVLINNGADIEYQSQSNSMTPIYIAEKFERDEILALLEDNI